MKAPRKRRSPVIIVTKTLADGIAQLYKEFGLPAPKGQIGIARQP